MKTQGLMALAAAALFGSGTAAGDVRPRYTAQPRLKRFSGSRGVRKKCEGCSNIMFDHTQFCFKCRSGVDNRREIG